jgi:trigger factor
MRRAAGFLQHSAREDHVMQLTEARSEGLLRVYRVVIPAADLVQELNAKIEEVRPRVRLNGFRPGKVPAAHIRKIYGPAMMKDVIDEQVQKGTQASLEQARLRPASEPRLDLKSDINEVQAGHADLAFDLSVEVMPDFEPADPGSLSLERPIAPVEESQVDEALATLLKENRTYEDKDGAAADGDALTIDFVGKIDGEAFEGGSAEDAVIVLGSKQLIPGFEDQLIGAKAGDERALNVTFPDDYAVEQLKAKPAVFEVKVKAVKAPKESQADDAFAAQMGFGKIDEVRDALRSRIEADHAAQSRAKVKRALFDHLDKMHSFDLPPGMVEAEFGTIWRQVDADRKAGRLDPDEAGKSEDELKADYRRIAERRVRLGLVLAEIGRRNKVEVTQQEVNQAIVAQARSFPGREREIADLYAKRPALLAQIRAPIYEEKVVDFILELAKVANRTVTREELFADDPAD